MPDLLFSPIQINQMPLKNRIYLPAMHMAMAKEFEVTDPLVAFYEERAKGGAGMIAVGFATVNLDSGSTLNIGAHDDRFIPGLSRLAEAINRHDCRSCVQLNHAGRYNFSFFMDGRPPVAPSPIASRMTRETPRELSLDDIAGVIDDFAKAAQRVKTAGYSAVEVLSGTGYLLSEFLSPLTNQRTDQYGGSLENRMRFGLDVMRAIRAAVGGDYPVMVRMNGNDFMPGGQGRLELRQYAKALVEQAGVDALCINVGWHEARVPQITTCVPRGAFGYLSAGIKQEVSVPVIASHRINDPATAREMIADGMCDMVAMGRSLIADPYLPQKAAEGREEEIVHCVACAQGCFDHLFQLKGVECLCNPVAGHEAERSPQKADKAKKVLVIGGGAAGLQAAITAARRGHDVTLYEQSGRLGGQLHLAGAAPGREDHVVLASGAVPVAPPIPGADLPHVVQSWDVLAGRAVAGRRVLVVGGGAVGVETALLLAEKGTLSGDALKFLLVNKAEDPETLFDLATQGSKEVTILEMMDRIGKDFGKTTRWGMMQDVERAGVRSMVAAKVLEIGPEAVKVQLGQAVEEIPADCVVLAVGSRPVSDLAEVLREAGVAFDLVGDAGAIGMAFDAIHQGHAAALKI